MKRQDVDERFQQYAMLDVASVVSLFWVEPKKTLGMIWVKVGVREKVEMVP